MAENGIKWDKMETFSMEKMEKPVGNSPFSPFYAIGPPPPPPPSYVLIDVVNKKCGRFSFVDGRSISRSVVGGGVFNCSYNLGSQSILILFISMQICGVTGRAPLSLIPYRI